MTRASFWRFIRSWGWCTSICRVRRQRSGGHVVLCHRSLFTELLIPDTREWLKWVEFLQNIELLESFTDFVKCCLSGNKSRLNSERTTTTFCECLGVFGWLKVRIGSRNPERNLRGKSRMTRNLRSSFKEGKAGTDFGLRTVLCHLLQITTEQSGRTTTRRKRLWCFGTSLPASPGWPRGCPVSAFGTSSPVLCHKHSSRIRKLNTLTVIIQYLNHLHISLVISA